MVTTAPTTKLLGNVGFLVLTTVGYPLTTVQGTYGW